jgi:hypothetical protein
MPVNQPPLSDNFNASTWDLEVTQTINTLEERVRALLEAIKNSSDLDDLKNKVNNL